MVEHDGPETASLGSPIFTLFNQLPIEIRLRIWEAAVPGPRVINIRERMRKDEDVTIDSGLHPLALGDGDETIDSGLHRLALRAANLSLSSASKAPAMLSVCRESRRVALLFYVPSFAFTSSAPETYFDFHVDTLYLRFDNFAVDTDDYDSFDEFLRELEQLWDAVNFRRVQKLALLLKWEDGNCHFQLAQVLGWFGHIRELIVVVSHFSQERDDQGDIMFYEPLDITKTRRNYDTFSPEISYNKTPDVPLAVDFVSAIGLEKELERYRQSNRDLEKELKDLGIDDCKDHGDIPMPQIEYKSVVTCGLGRHLDGLRKEYQRIRTVI